MELINQRLANMELMDQRFSNLEFIVSDLAQNMENIENIENNEYSIGIFFDLAKAFDTVNHKILLKKLENYGIRGEQLKWFTSYFKNRQQYKCVCFRPNGAFSDLRAIDYGV